MVCLTRRDIVIGAAAAALAPRVARAAAFPTRNIQFIIPYAAGGGFDSIVRFVSPVMETLLPARASIVPVNITAASGSRAISQLYRSKPDGYTIGIFDVPGMFIQQAVQGSAAYDLNRFSWIGCMGEAEHYVVCVGPNSPLRTFDDMKALSQKRPVKFGVTGLEGTATAATIIGTELLGIRRQLITGYRGSSDYIVGAIRGDVDGIISATATTMRYAKGGQLRIIASFETKTDIPGIPDATALGKPELDQITVERPVAAPPGLPQELQTTLSAALNAALADPKVVAWAKENDIIIRSKTPAETVALIGRQRAFFEKWKPLLVTG